MYHFAVALKNTTKTRPGRKMAGFFFLEYSSWYYKICYTVDILWYTSLPSFRSNFDCYFWKLKTNYILAFKKHSVVSWKRSSHINNVMISNVFTRRIHKFHFIFIHDIFNQFHAIDIHLYIHNQRYMKHSWDLR